MAKSGKKPSGGDWKRLARDLTSSNLSQAMTACEELQDKLGGSLQAYFYRRLPRSALKLGDHCDCEQEVWLRLWQNARSGSFDPRRNVVAYIWGIARNVLLEQIRDLPPDLTSDTGELPPPDDIVEQDENLRNLSRCLSRLGDKDPQAYDAVMETWFSELSERKAARKLRISASTLHERKHHGLEFLKRCLDGKLPRNEP